jgi:hypothetical protein
MFLSLFSYVHTHTGGQRFTSSSYIIPDHTNTPPIHGKLPPAAVMSKL